MVMPDLHILQEKLRPSDVDAGDGRPRAARRSMYRAEVDTI